MQFIFSLILFGMKTIPFMPQLETIAWDSKQLLSCCTMMQNDKRSRQACPYGNWIAIRTPYQMFLLE
jgi:hypothetical protein